MTIIRTERENGFEFDVHAETRFPGFVSKVSTRKGADGKVYSYHWVRDMLSESLEHAPTADYQLKGTVGHKYASYASADPNAVHEYLKRHRRAVEMWMELYMQKGMTLDDALRVAASEQYEER